MAGINYNNMSYNIPLEGVTTYSYLLIIVVIFFITIHNCKFVNCIKYTFSFICDKIYYILQWLYCNM